MLPVRLLAPAERRQMENFNIYVPKAKWKHQGITIADLIPIGSENAVSRDYLVTLCVKNGLVDEKLKPESRDRALRQLIEHARIDYTILNLSDGRGYYRPSREDLMELQKYIWQEESRAKSIFKNLSMAKKLYEDYKTGRL